MPGCLFQVDLLYIALDVPHSVSRLTQFSHTQHTRGSKKTRPLPAGGWSLCFLFFHVLGKIWKPSTRYAAEFFRFSSPPSKRNCCAASLWRPAFLVAGSCVN